MIDYVFFTLNNFSHDDGGTVRIKGIVNALAECGMQVTLISNMKNDDGFHQRVNHIDLNYNLTKTKKRLFQLSLSVLPNILHKWLFRRLLLVINESIKKNSITRSLIIFFEYIDNSIGYCLKRNKIINSYTNDIHGIAPLEFKLKESKSTRDKFINYIKFKLSQRLDREVFLNAGSLWFVSESIKEYYEKEYPSIRTNNNRIIRDGCSKEFYLKVPDLGKVKELGLKYDIKVNDKVIFFAGDFKDLGGVLDLLEAFEIILKHNKIKTLKLILVGNGERFSCVQRMIIDRSMESNVVLTGRVLYSELRDYQELADVIVCPDKQHPFSELIPHIKYFDSLVSGKIVINGSFKSVCEININEKYSINFIPSNIIDLANKIEYAFEKFDSLKSKYSNNAKLFSQKFSYNNSVQTLLN
jgi:glycosyltransferase involved in cell wall biosynthesis